MSVKEAVQFRFLASQLTSQEINRFLFNLSDKQPSLLMSALCHHFMSDSTMVRTINGTVSDIITTRKPKLPNARLDIVQSELPSDPIPTPVHFNDIPIPVVSIISSFMNQREYSKFSRTNRFTFLGCHSPNTLQEINFYGEPNHPFKYQLYPNVKCLLFWLSEVSHRFIHEIMHQSFLDQLESLSVYQDTEYYKDDSNTDLLAECLAMCCNVKKLSFLGFDSERCSTDLLYEILWSFPNTEYLALRGCVTVDGNRILSLLPSLKGISINPNNMHLIPILADKLEFLELLRDYPGDNTGGFTSYDNLHDSNFAKLTQFKVRGPVSTKSLNNIVETAKNLKKLYISMYHLPILEEVMKRCRSLEYIGIVEYGDIVKEAMDEITNGLRTAAKKTNLKIEIHIIARTTKLDVFLRSVSSLIGALQCKTTHFMLVWKVGSGYFCNFGKEDIIETAQQLENTLNESIVIKVENTSMIVAMNKGCTINGYQETWDC